MAVELKQNDLVVYTIQGSAEIRQDSIRLSGKHLMLGSRTFKMDEMGRLTEDGFEVRALEVFRRNGNLFNRVWHDSKRAK